MFSTPTGGSRSRETSSRSSDSAPRYFLKFSLALTASMTYSCPMVIIETPIFTRQLLSTLSDEEYRLFQATLQERPDAGKVIPGGGGLRKVRWGLEGRGKSGGARVIYYWFTAQGTILLLFMYPKNVQDNLTQDQLKQLKRIIEEEYHER
jgi:mRNA-degrading endonuclease RelE of RelBE toxin-antitoxin system